MILLYWYNRTTAAIERATEAEERERNLEGALIQERLQVQESQRRFILLKLIIMYLLKTQ